MDAAAAGHHKGFTCDGCGACPIVGTRHTKSPARNYDLCPSCFDHLRATYTHDAAAYTDVEPPSCITKLASASGYAEVYLVGTAHISAESAAEVAAAIAAIQPDCVLLEVCQARKQMLSMQELKVLTTDELMTQLADPEQSNFSVIYGWYLSTMAEKMKAVPGAEFRSAYLAVAELHRAATAQPLEVGQSATALQPDPAGVARHLLEQLLVGGGTSTFTVAELRAAAEGLVDELVRARPAGDEAELNEAQKVEDEAMRRGWEHLAMEAIALLVGGHGVVAGETTVDGPTALEKIGRDAAEAAVLGSAVPADGVTGWAADALVAVEEGGRGARQLTPAEAAWANLRWARARTTCPLILADRHITPTVQRAWASLRPYEKYRMVGEMVWGGMWSDDDELAELIGELKAAGSDSLTAQIEELGKTYPRFKEVLLDERDTFLAENVRRHAAQAAGPPPGGVAKATHAPDGSVRLQLVGGGEDGLFSPAAWPTKVVAVVGAGHVPGIKAYWERVAADGGPKQAAADLGPTLAIFEPGEYDRLECNVLGCGLVAATVGLAYGSWQGSKLLWRTEWANDQQRLAAAAGGAAAVLAAYRYCLH